MKPSVKIPASVRRAYQTAKKSRMKAYAPYSKYKVGAGLVAKGGKLFPGANVENASYGGAICAEQVAILKAASEGARKFTDIVVVTSASPPGFPCGRCLQMMAEFFAPETRIWVGDMKQIRDVRTFLQLVPKPFGPAQLREAK